MVDLNEIRENLIQGKASRVKELVQKAIDEGQDVEKVLSEELISGMHIVGEKFGGNDDGKSWI